MSDSSGQIQEFKLKEGQEIPYEILSLIPKESAEFYKMAPVNLSEGVLYVAMVDPDNLDARSALNFIAKKQGLPFKIFKISPEDFEKVLKMYSSVGGEIKSALDELNDNVTEEQKQIQKELDNQTSGKSVQEYIKEDAPIIKIVASILRYAIEGGASDIHIEPREKKVMVRFRVDGELHSALNLPKNVHSALVARIKVLALLRLDEKRKPQDGRFSAKIDGRKIDFRVSTFPTYFGEKIVMRILDRTRGFIPIDKLGLTQKNESILRAAITKPHGLILISGPTGSGKTTTLYSILAELDKETKNIISLEDPIEYYLDGVNQSQVKPEIGYTFATGLRSVLRQDPDIIMVGEIRDEETARLAIQAALTGHLVLSTIHTNSAIGVVPRLVDMGIDPYLIAPTLVLAIAQRLVRKLCPTSKRLVDLPPSLRVMIESDFSDLPLEYRPNIPDKVYEAEPSPECAKGVKGRVAVFEMLPASKELEHIILTNPSEEQIRKVARSQGMLTMKEDAYLKAFEGIIPFSEVTKLSGQLIAETSDIHKAAENSKKQQNI